ncbi:MAG: PilZ domain-containing protein [Planctomycetota bacterium]
MLDVDSNATSVAEIIASLPCEVALPESWRDFFSEKGELPSFRRDRRRFPRLLFRTAAAARFLKSLPALNRSDQWQKVYFKDVSRTGFSFLYAQQLFPNERVEIVVNESHRYVGKVRRCRRVGPRCYVVGARFCGTNRN